MQTGFGLYQQQTAKMVMTPGLRQAIEILQLSALELFDYISWQVSENPLLEPIETDWNTLASFSRQHTSSDVHMRRDYSPLSMLACNTLTLETYLTEQLNLSNHIPLSVRRIAKYLIGDLDDNGYLFQSTEQVAEKLRVHVTEVEQALKIVQSFEPAGIGARNLRECLLLQLEQSPVRPPLVFRLITDHLEDIAHHSILKLSHILQATPQEIQEAVDFIKSFNPRPGAIYSTDEPKYINPDVTVENFNGQYVVSVYEASAPRLSINEHYQRMLKQYNEINETRKYIHGKLTSALHLIKCIEQRRLTLYRVTEAIVEHQTDFLDHGISRLKPLTLKQIADKIGVHESTVSRATSNKYAQTPRGMFELKFFFSCGLNSHGAEDASSESVKALMKEWIDNENRHKPYSDQKLTDLLAQQGINISRRTITKYREELGITSSVKRKRF